jgi:hypothetical protein
MGDEETRWRAITQAWEERLADAGLADLAQAMREAMRPLAPLAAQLVWFAQPAFALFGRYEAAGELAEYLNDPDALDKPRSRTRQQDRSGDGEGSGRE